MPQQQWKDMLAQDVYSIASMRSRHPPAAVSMNRTTKLEYDPNCSQWPWLLCRVCDSDTCCEYGPGDVGSLNIRQHRASCESTSDRSLRRLSWPHGSEKKLSHLQCPSFSHSYGSPQLSSREWCCLAQVPVKEGLTGVFKSTEISYANFTV